MPQLSKQALKAREAVRMARPSARLLSSECEGAALASALAVAGDGVVGVMREKVKI